MIDKHLLSIGKDAEADVHRLLCEPEVYEFLVDGAAPPRSVTSDWIADAVESSQRGGGLWALSGADDAQILGLVRLAADDNRELELTYLLHPSVWGNGHATRMAHTAMHHAFGVGAVSTIWAGTDVPNAASIAVMQRLGMRFRRAVDYPAGPGVEYEMQVTAFEASLFERLPMIDR